MSLIEQRQEKCTIIKSKKAPAATADDLPVINAIIAKGDRAEVGPGPNGTIKISRVKRVIVKSGR